MGKNEILIRNFGPIDEARIDLNDKFQIFIGAQASGKTDGYVNLVKTLKKTYHGNVKIVRRQFREKDLVLSKEQ